MSQRDLKYINGGRKLDWDSVSSFAINHDLENAVCFAGGFRNQVLTVVGTGTVLVYGSTQKTPPNFNSASTIDNSWFLVTLADYSVPNTYYAGATGAVVSTSTKAVELNTNVLTWVGLHRSASTVDVKITESDNL